MAHSVSEMTDSELARAVANGNNDAVEEQKSRRENRSRMKGYDPNIHGGFGDPSIRLSLERRVRTEAPLPPPGPELRAANRILTAERCNWPDGALDACNQLERDYPEFHVWWSHGTLPSEEGEGFYALWVTDHRREAPRYYGKTHEELAARLDALPKEDLKW